MKVYICSRDIEGLLSAVFCAYSNKEQPLISFDPSSVMLGDEEVRVEKSESQAKRVMQSAVRIDRHFAYNLELLLSCEKPAMFELAHKYLRLLFAAKKPIRDIYANRQEVYDFHRVVKAVTNEQSRLWGFIRLQETQSKILYGRFSSEYDMIKHILPHFAERFNTEKIILHDVTRNKMGIAAQGNQYYEALLGEAIPTLSQEEELYSELYKQYLTSVAVPGRENEKLRNKFFPKKYRWFAE